MKKIVSITGTHTRQYPLVPDSDSDRHSVEPPACQSHCLGTPVYCLASLYMIDSPNLTLKVDLGGIHFEYAGENWPCYHVNGLVQERRNSMA